MKRETRWILLWGIALLLISAVAFDYGRGAHARLEQAEAATSEEEINAFCRGLGLVADNGTFARCTSGLHDLTRHLRERWERDAAGVL